MTSCQWPHRRLTEYNVVYYAHLCPSYSTIHSSIHSSTATSIPYWAHRKWETFDITQIWVITFVTLALSPCKSSSLFYSIQLRSRFSIVSMGADLDFANENFYSIRQVVFWITSQRTHFPPFNKVSAHSLSRKRTTKGTHEWRLPIRSPRSLCLHLSSNLQRTKSRTNIYISTAKCF